MAITAKQMAHRDIPVVFHHINFTPLPPVFQKCDKMETGRRRRGRNREEGIKEILRRKKTTSWEIHKAGNVNLKALFLVRVIAVIAVS